MASLDDRSADTQIEAGQPREWMTRRFIIALVLVGALAIGSFVIFQLSARNSQTVTASIEFLGRQRIMLERSALQLHLMRSASNNFDYNQARARLIETIDVLERGHRSVVGAVSQFGQTERWQGELYRIYFGAADALDAKMRRYIALNRQVTGLNEATVQRRTEMINSLITDFEPVIEAELAEAMLVFQSEGAAALNRIQNVQFGVLIAILGLLMLEGLIIFRPMIDRVDAEITRNAAISAKLRQAADTLEQEVRARTADLEAARQEAERANIAKSRFLAAAGHDLLQPLEAIALFAGALDRTATEDRSRAIISDLRGAQRSMRRLLNSLLDMSQIEAGAIEPNPDQVAVDPLLAALHAEFEAQANQKGLSIATVKSGADIIADRLLLERTLRNLIANAIRYTEQGRILIGVRHLAETVRIEVHDTGPGIAPADLKRIFDEFHQLNDPGRDKSEGLGLGLTIASRFAEMMDMKLSVRSNPGKGSVFSLEAPRA